MYHYIMTQSFITPRSDKLILLWTPFFGVSDYMPVGEGALAQSGCPEPHCEVTIDRSRLQESEAIVFHCRDVSVVDLPVFRAPEQKWIYYCLESPHHSYFAAFRFMKHMFNWTMSYRLDSDVITSYGIFRKKKNSSLQEDTQLLNVWKGKKKTAVWLVSNCATPGNREGFVENLKKYIDVDVYGTCGQNKCPNDKLHHCLKSYVRDYMFFLSLENSICKDYVTEKFYRMLNYKIIPVVFGGADYSLVAPPHSYINALSFKDTVQLAHYLRTVAANYSLYKSYFEWKEQYYIPPPFPLICELCRKLHLNNEVNRKVYHDISAWWVEDSKCQRWGN